MTRHRVTAGWVSVACTLVAAVAAGQEAPYPPSPLIARVQWHMETHQQHAPGSDQWPMTWAEDGHLYAAWGDGWGWQGQGQGNARRTKRSIGVTRIEGEPGAMRGVDLWGEGPGSGFGKPDALIAVDGAIYMFWTRGDSKGDLDNTASAVSRDGGRTWQLNQGRAFPNVPDGLRVRGICQFGKGYEGAPTDHVYVYFAHNRASDLFLARVPRQRILDASAYEWFEGLTDDGGARWTRASAERRPVFHDPNGSVWHVGVSYNPGLDRYLLTKPHYCAGDDRAVAKLAGSGLASLGVFDAPAPWGPWTTVFYVDNFRDGLLKFSYFIPTKFISGDGQRFWLAWSGWPEYDNVNFVEGRFVLRQ